MIAPHLFFFFFSLGGGTPPSGPAAADAPIMLVRFARMGIR
jgi:hypothetical protein